MDPGRLKNQGKTDVPRYRSLLVRVVLAVAIGIAFPFLELAWKCREGVQGSEACVWGKAYLALSLWVEPLIIAPIAFLLLTLLARLGARGPRDKPRSPNEKL